MAQMLLHAAAEKPRFTGDCNSRADLDHYIAKNFNIPAISSDDWEDIHRDHGPRYSVLIAALVSFYKNHVEEELLDGCPALWYTDFAVCAMKLAETWSVQYRDHLALTFGTWMEHYPPNR